MPFINVKTNVPVGSDKEKAIKSALGRDITALPGKTENWLMVGLEPECHLWFKGTDEPAALVDVSVYGGADADAYRALTGKVSALLAEELGLKPDRIYVKYSSTPDWGWTGDNF